MKAISILALALVAGVSASAQKSLVKEVERDLKSTPENYPSLIQKLTPAFTNDETAQDVRTYLVAGNGAYAFYDKQSVFAQMGKDVDKSSSAIPCSKASTISGKRFPSILFPMQRVRSRPKTPQNLQDNRLSLQRFPSGCRFPLGDPGL